MYAGYTVPHFWVQWFEIITKDKFRPHVYGYVKVISYILSVIMELIVYSWNLCSIYMPAYLMIISC